MTAPMTDAELAEAEKLCEHATPGPWRWGDWRTTFGLIESEFRLTLEHNKTHGADPSPVHRNRGDGCLLVMHADEPPSTADATFIAAARALVPRLLAELARLKAAESSMRPTYAAAVRWYQSDDHDQQAFHDLTNAIASSLAKGPYR